MRNFKRYSVFLLFSLGLTLTASSQTYHTLFGNHQTWEQFQGNTSSSCTLQSGQIIFEGNDTIIQGLSYKKLLGYRLYSNTAGCFTYPFFINDTIFESSIVREDTVLKKVFIYDKNNNTEFLLYDFNATDGDTLVNPYFANFQSSPFDFIVDSVRLINISNVGIRNCFYINIPGSSGLYYYIESIGGITGINISGAQAIGEVNTLQCVRDSMNISIFGSCFVNLGIHSNNIKSIIGFNYNNYTHSFSLSNENKNEIFSVNIINSLGQILFTINEVNIDQIYFINKYSQGLFFYSIYDNNKLIKTGKFIQF